MSNVIDANELKLAVLKIRSLGELATQREKTAFLRRGARILRDAARENVPIAQEPYKMRDGRTVMPGFTRNAIEVKKLKRSQDLWVGVVKRGGILAYWAAWLEFGASNRDGSKRAGAGYMRRAVASTKETVKKAIIQDAEKAFKKIVQRVSK